MVRAGAGEGASEASTTAISTPASARRTTTAWRWRAARNEAS